MSDEPNNHEVQEQDAKGIDGRLGCVALAVIGALIALTAFGFLEMSSLLMAFAAIVSIVGWVEFIARRRKRSLWE
jgi:hypothetical protein